MFANRLLCKEWIMAFLKVGQCLAIFQFYGNIMRRLTEVIEILKWEEEASAVLAEWLFA